MTFYETVNIDSGEKNRKMTLFTRVFGIECFVFGVCGAYNMIWQQNYHLQYLTRNTKHMMTETLHEFIKVEDLRNSTIK
jgi:hypothetical protein